MNFMINNNDKLSHAFWSGIITLISGLFVFILLNLLVLIPLLDDVEYVIEYTTKVKLFVSIISMVYGLSVGIGKEFADHIYSRWDWTDMGFNIIGCLIGGLIVFSALSL